MAFSSVPVAAAPTFGGMLRTINDSHARELSLSPSRDLSRYEYRLPQNDVGFSASELRAVTDYSSEKTADGTLITEKQAESDADLFFRVLRYCYAPYGYFGGDKTFGRARTQVLLALRKGGKITTEDFGGLLAKNLAFVEDAHFSIGGIRIVSEDYYYSSDELQFLKDAFGYYKPRNGKKIYVKSINGRDPAEFMKLSVNTSGRLVYYAGALLQKSRTGRLQDKIAVKVSYRGGGEDSMTLEPSYLYRTQGENYSLAEDGGVPVVSLRRCFDESPEDDSCENFVSSAAKLKNAPVLILDIRGNIGGSDSYISQWIHDLTGCGNFSENSSLGELDSRAGSFIFAKTLLAQPKLTTEAKSALQSCNAIYQSGQNTWENTDMADKLKIYGGGRLVFVLTDKSDASSGESIVSMLRSMKNTVFVGTNTDGCLMGNAEVQFVLPDSRLSVVCGNFIDLYNPKVMSEGAGFMPDIWDGGDSLGDVLSLIKRCNIK